MVIHKDPEAAIPDENLCMNPTYGGRASQTPSKRVRNDSHVDVENPEPEGVPNPRKASDARKHLRKWRFKTLAELHVEMEKSRAEGLPSDPEVQNMAAALQSHLSNKSLSLGELVIAKEFGRTLSGNDKLDFRTLFVRLMTPELYREWFLEDLAHLLNVADPGRGLKANLSDKMLARCLALLPRSYHTRLIDPLKRGIDAGLDQIPEQVALLFNVSPAPGVFLSKRLFTCVVHVFTR